MSTLSAVRGYELRERIGKGSFGEVHRAYQPAVDREVAIKIILPEYADKPDFIRGFESEARLVARLEHLHLTVGTRYGFHRLCHNCRCGIWTPWWYDQFQRHNLC